MHRADDCIFCMIVSGEAPCSRVYEDELVIVFMDIYPASRGHTLVVPKEHFRDILHIDDEPMRAVASVARRVAAAIEATLTPDGISVVQGNGTAAGQTVMHYHVHLLPRTTGAKMRLHGPRQAEQTELDEVASALTNALGVE